MTHIHPGRPSRRSRAGGARRRNRPITVTVSALLVAGGVVGFAGPAQAATPFPLDVPSLDGTGNNVANPTWGSAGRPFVRLAPASYPDGISAPDAGPNARYLSNRIFNDVNQNVFSERRVSQWGWTWGQFLDHTVDKVQSGTESANIPFNQADPLESFTNDLGVIGFTRSAAAPGTGTSTTNPRQQVNSLPTYLNAHAVYGASTAREDWLRDGPVDGDPTNNKASLLLPNGYLPRRDTRGDAASAPAMDVDGRLTGDPAAARVAGDVRANENLALTATQTLFAREHNRIVALLPSSLSEEDKFQVARRVVMAEQQYITYQEFLPAMGVSLPQYTGYKSTVNPTVSSEFATVGFRAHSQIHGEFTFTTNVSRYSAADLDFFQQQGLTLTTTGGSVEVTIPLGVAFFNPDLLQRLQLGPFLGSLLESEYRNDEMIDNQLRSTLFQVPVSGNPTCLDGPTMPQCFRGVSDLGAIDVQRGRDHGMPTYNVLRRTFGLAPVTSFTQITGESTDQFPAGSGIDNPNSLAFVSMADIDGQPMAVGAADGGVTGVRRSTVAARLRAIYGSVDNIDAFVGMSAEKHVAGTEFGPLQLAIWAKTFQQLRDGDRFYFGNQQQALSDIRNTYGIDYRRTLAQVIAANTDTPASSIPSNVFLVSDQNLPATTCTVTYTVTTSWQGGYQVNMTIADTGTAAINGWTLRFQLDNGQQLTGSWNGTFTQSGQNGADVTVTSTAGNGVIAAGSPMSGIGFNATWDNLVNARPANVSVNGRRCSVS